MKMFGYTLRDKSGALKKGTLQAVDRIDALRQITAMGCVPVSVLEGRGAAPGTRELRNSAWNRRGTVWLAVAATVILIAALAVWLTVDRKPAAKHPATVTAVAKKPVKGRPVQTANQTIKPVQDIPQPAAETPSEDVRQTAEDLRDPPHQPTVEALTVQTEGVKPKQPPRPKPFNSATEGLLSMAMSVPPGSSIPPLPISPNLDADFAKSLTNEIVIYADDDERTATTKENVAVAKNQLRELVKEGRSVSEVLKEYQDKTNERAAMRREAQRELAALYNNGSPEEAQAYLEKVNKAFEELGVEPISLPRVRKEQ